MFMFIQSLFTILRRDTYVYSLHIIILFHGGNALLVDNVLRVTSSVQEVFVFFIVNNCCHSTCVWVFFLQNYSRIIQEEFS